LIRANRHKYLPNSSSSSRSSLRSPCWSELLSKRLRKFVEIADSGTTLNPKECRAAFKLQQPAFSARPYRLFCEMWIVLSRMCMMFASLNAQWEPNITHWRASIQK